MLSANNYYLGNAYSGEFTYTNVVLALTRHNIITEQTRVYERLGIGALIPDQRISSQVGMNMILVLGLEYFVARSKPTDHTLSFYGELGISAPILHRLADRIPGSPRYASGALTTVGGRYYF